MVSKLYKYIATYWIVFKVMLNMDISMLVVLGLLDLVWKVWK